MTLISAIMPTTIWRTAWLPLSLRCWQVQTHEDRELIVVGPAPVVDLLPNDSRIRFVEASGITLGAKRNLAASHARGQYVAHWDDDDWYAPWRLEAQLEAIRIHRTRLSGVRTLFFFDVTDDEVWRYDNTPELPGAAGTSLFYEHGLWQEHPFASVDSGEDVRWCHEHREPIAPPSRIICVASTHDTNTSPRRTRAPEWRRATQQERDGLPREANAWMLATRVLLS